MSIVGFYRKNGKTRPISSRIRSKFGSRIIKHTHVSEPPFETAAQDAFNRAFADNGTNLTIRSRSDVLKWLLDWASQDEIKDVYRTISSKDRLKYELMIAEADYMKKHRYEPNPNSAVTDQIMMRQNFDLRDS